MALLKDAIASVLNELKTIPGIRRVPDEPPANNEQFPFAVGYPSSGRYTQGPATMMKGLHDVNIELHVALVDMPRDYSELMDLIDEIPYQLMKLRKDGLLTNMATFGDITYTFGPMEWAKVKH